MAGTLTDFDNYLDLVGQKNHLDWDLQTFKDTQPTFYKTLLEAVKLTLEKE